MAASRRRRRFSTTSTPCCTRPRTARSTPSSCGWISRACRSRADAELFQKLAALGARLTALHLLKSPELDPPACRFEGEGDSRVGKGRKAGLRYEPDEQRVYINATQYFAPVPEAVWTYQVGGYQVCEKWLKDRQERRLEVDDIRTYCRIVTALGLTLDIQQEIDALYPQAESKTVTLSVGTRIGE